MKYAVFFTDKAFEDLDHLTNYIACELLSPETAENIYQMILREIERLSEFPLIHPQVGINEFEHSGIRKMIVKQYSVFYLTQENPPLITIIRILHQLQEQTRTLVEWFY